MSTPSHTPDLIAAAAAAARSAGWRVVADTTEANVRVDLLCRSDTAAVAMNFELARYDSRQVLARHTALARAGVRAAWFFAAAPAFEFAEHPTVVFTVADAAATPRSVEAEWCFAGARLRTVEAVAALLSGDFRLRPTLLLSGPFYVNLRAAMLACPSCGRAYRGVLPRVLRLDDHGNPFDPTLDAEGRLDAEGAYFAGLLVARIVALDPWRPEPTARWRTAQRKPGRPPRWTNGCPSCGAEHPPLADPPSVALPPPFDSETQAGGVTYAIAAPPQSVRFVHWCYRPSTTTGVHCPKAVVGERRPSTAGLGPPAPAVLPHGAARNRSVLWTHAVRTL